MVVLLLKTTIPCPLSGFNPTQLSYKERHAMITSRVNNSFTKV